MILKQKIEPLVIDDDKTKVLAHILGNPTDSTDSVESEEQISKFKKPFTTFNLYVRVKDKTLVLGRLFQRQLNALIAQYGENTQNWINLPVEITGVKNGDYYNAVIKPTKEFEEEELR